MDTSNGQVNTYKWLVNIFFMTCFDISRVTMMVEESNITRSEDDYLNAEKDVNVTDAVFPLAMR